MLLRSVHQESLYCPSLVLQRHEEWESEILDQTQEPAGRQSKQEKKTFFRNKVGDKDRPQAGVWKCPMRAGFSKSASRTEMEQAPGASSCGGGQEESALQKS